MRCKLSEVPHVTLPWRTGEAEPQARDMGLIRLLLLAMESGGQKDIDPCPWSEKTIRAHLAMMIDGGLLKGKTTGPCVVVEGITWAGHDFLGAIREESVWRQVTARIKQAGGGLAFEAIKQLALSYLPS